MDFQNRVVVVTGGANGIGRATVESFLTAGAVVAFVDTDKEAGEKIVSRFATNDVYFHHGDIAEEAALHAFAEAVKQRFGKVDYLVNNACISKKGILSECSYQDFNYVLGFGRHGAIPVDEFAFAGVHSWRFGREHRIKPRFHVARGHRKLFGS